MPAPAVTDPSRSLSPRPKAPALACPGRTGFNIRSPFKASPVRPLLHTTYNTLPPLARLFSLHPILNSSTPPRHSFSKNAALLPFSPSSILVTSVLRPPSLPFHLSHFLPVFTRAEISYPPSEPGCRKSDTTNEIPGARLRARYENPPTGPTATVNRHVSSHCALHHPTGKRQIDPRGRAWLVALARS